MRTWLTGRSSPRWKMAKTLTTTEAARELGVSNARIRQLAAVGLLRGEKRGRDWFFDAESVEERKRRMADG